MENHFKPLRRKIGIATLVMACVFAGGWVRSLTHTDSLWVTSPDIQHMFTSQRGAFRWGKQIPNLSHDYSFDLSEVPDAIYRNHDTFWRSYEMDWRYGIGEFDFGAGTESGDSVITRMERWCVPYWSIVIPLVLLSAWLLFSTLKFSDSSKKAEA